MERLVLWFKTFPKQVFVNQYSSLVARFSVLVTPTQQNAVRHQKCSVKSFCLFFTQNKIKTNLEAKTVSKCTKI